ncbi:MAG: hypothetical protein ACD_28C00276G0001 [uncultured bacterium]|nr:MAG: hypothetical protein ACD_28C00276G0001 [uncultured bacterium]
MEEAEKGKKSDKADPDKSEENGEKKEKKAKQSAAGGEGAKQESTARNSGREDKSERRVEASSESLRNKRSIEITKAENLDGYVKKFLKDNLGSEKVDESLVASAVMVLDKHLVNESGRHLVIKQDENIFAAVDQKIKNGEKIYISGTIFEAAQARAKQEGGKDILSVQKQKETFQKGPAQAASAPNPSKEASVSTQGEAGDSSEVAMKRANQEKKVEAAEVRNKAALEFLPPNVAKARKLNLINHLQDQYGIGRQRNLRYFLHTNYRNAQEFLQTMESTEGQSRKAKRNAIQNILGVKNFLGLGDVGQAERYAAAFKDIEGRIQSLKESGFKLNQRGLYNLSIDKVMNLIVQGEEWVSMEGWNPKDIYSMESQMDLLTHDRRVEEL